MPKKISKTRKSPSSHKKTIEKLQEKYRLLKEKLEQKENDHKKELKHLALVFKKITGQNPSKKFTIIDYLIESHNYMDSIISLAPGHIFWLDRNNVYLGCNNEQAEAAGLASREDIIGKTNADLPWKAQSKIIDKINNQVMKSGKEIIIEETPDTANGARTYLSAKVPLKNSKGDIVGLLGTAFDITEQKKTIKLLAIEKKKAEEASWAKSEFIQNMSHDLKNPLMNVMGMAELLAETEDDNTRKEHLMMIHRGGERILQMFTNILDAVSIEAGSLSVKKEEVDVRSILQHIEESYSSLMDEKHIYLHVHTDSDVPHKIISDPMRMERILLNLVGNALKFTNQGGVTINISFVQEKKDKKYLIMAVSDTGIGMPANKLELIFEKFVRLTASHEGIYPGTGLGLSIVKKFIEELDGTIQVESVEGKGTTFTARIPVDEERR